MFSGIVETTGCILSIETRPGVLQLTVVRPPQFEDLKLGDSICVNGVCLTVEKFSAETLQFALGEETLRVTGWADSLFVGQVLNLERSLRWGDRVHGHLVSGHVDGQGTILKIVEHGEGLSLLVAFSSEFKGLIWNKGSICMNGVSLTVNQLESLQFTVGLIPETVSRTNLKTLRVGDRVNLELDMVAKALSNWVQMNLASAPHSGADLGKHLS